MKAHLHWTGVRMRTLDVSSDPDSTALRAVTLPSHWKDDAARALVTLTPTQGGPVRLAAEAARWADMIDTMPGLSVVDSPVTGAETEAEAIIPQTPDGKTKKTGQAKESKKTFSVGRSLSYLLLTQQMAPNTALWQRQPDAQPGFVLKISAFIQEGSFEQEQFIACLKLACESLWRLQAAQSHERSGALPLFEESLPATNGTEANDCEESAGLVLLTDLDAALAGLGLDYDSEAARQFAIAITALARLVLKAGTATPSSVVKTPLFPDIERAALAFVATHSSESQSGKIRFSPIGLGYSSPGAVDALLDVETCGLAPVFSLLDNEGHLRLSTLNRLAYRGLTVESALALALDGKSVLPQPDRQSHTRMQDALAAYVDFLPPRPEPETEEAITRLERGVRRPLPMRQTGFSQQAAIGGHRLFMRASEFEDGTLGALSLTSPRETAMARGLMESLGQAVSIGLQFGAPLEAYIEQFAYTHFGPCGTVEGDPGTLYATSMLDYAFRALSEVYLKVHMPNAPAPSYDATQEKAGQAENTKYVEDETPFLPFSALPLTPSPSASSQMTSHDKGGKIDKKMSEDRNKNKDATEETSKKSSPDKTRAGKRRLRLVG